MKQKNIIIPVFLIVTVLLFSSCSLAKLVSIDAETDKISLEGAVLTEIADEFLGDNLHSNMRAFEYQDNRLHMLLTANVAPATGTGQGLFYWTRLHNGDWEKHEFLHDRTVGMANIVMDNTVTDDLFFIYNDRTVDNDRYAYMVRFDGSDIRQVFSLSQKLDGQVLNPQAVSSEDGFIHIFVPDRTGTKVRWYHFNIETEEVMRLNDITMPVRGGRMYDLVYQNGQILAPISVEGRLYLGILDTDKLTAKFELLDSFSSPDRMPARAMNIYIYENLGLYLITYLRPASFSNRPFTGLLGEVVANAVDMSTYKSVKKTVIGGFNKHTAATHYLKSEQLNDRMFVTAYTAVDQVHQFHLTEEHTKYVSSHVDVWELDSTGAVKKAASRVYEKTSWDHVLTRIDDNTFLFTYNETTDKNQKWIKKLKLEYVDKSN